MKDGDFLASSGLGGEPDRFSEVVESTSVAETGAGEPAGAERARRAFEAELVCQGERTIGHADGSVMAALEGFHSSDMAECFDQAGAGREGFQQGERLVRRGLPSGDRRGG